MEIFTSPPGRYRALSFMNYTIIPILYYYILLLSVPVTFRTVRFVTFVLFSRERTTTPSTVSLLFAHGFSSQIFILCLSKHAGLLKFLLHDSHGIRTSGNAHGGTDMQSLHDCSRLCVTSRLHPLLQPLKTYFFAIAHVIFVITW